MNKPFMYLIGYDREFKKNCNTGFGCGYVAIPIEHKLSVNHCIRLIDENKKASETEEYFYVNPYFEHKGLEQEITYTERRTIKGSDYIVIGFDTAHSWNNETHDFDYVFDETLKMLNTIENT